MKVFWLLGLLAITLVMVSAEEKVPEGFQHWTGASLKDLEQTLKSEADASCAPHVGARPGGFSSGHVHAFTAPDRWHA